MAVQMILLNNFIYATRTSEIHREGLRPAATIRFYKACHGLVALQGCTLYCQCIVTCQMHSTEDVGLENIGGASSGVMRNIIGWQYSCFYEVLFNQSDGSCWTHYIE
ncbi:uncharacterized protein [Fopius arisanus]|uniref:Uncharacterized protein n=1 Tax=Fopius arisanus TaxID=64838 RepID=A0A9R1TVJ5_9HYME|nr:PREDICTED: uncharacterized protein LOC105263415 [Fopius arisanus]